jgi:hypothetical protein
MEGTCVNASHFTSSKLILTAIFRDDEIMLREAALSLLWLPSCSKSSKKSITPTIDILVDLVEIER